MKHNLQLIFILIFLLSYDNVLAQQISKEWDVRFGGLKDDRCYAIQQSSDGGYILGGYTDSEIGDDITQNSQGLYDFWIVKTDANGIKQWDKRFGGTLNDYSYSIIQTSDGGYLCGGNSNSDSNGDKSETSRGGSDYWIVKIDSIGEKQWDKRYGGKEDDLLFSIASTSNGGYILGGYSLSGSTGDKSQTSYGANDYWLIKINNIGEIEWDKSFGGTNDDLLLWVEQTIDGGYILGGFSNSGISGEKSEDTKGVNDYWIVKTDSEGNKEWDHDFGGSKDDFLYSIKQQYDGGYILGGYSGSDKSGDKSIVNKGSSDYWIIKTDALGIKKWDAAFGGGGADILRSVDETFDGGYILGGRSKSGISGDKSEASIGNWDYWILKTDSLGIKLWDKGFGGTGDDILRFLQQTTDGSYILGGRSNSPLSGDKSQDTHGNYDFWLLKTTPDCIPKSFYLDEDSDGYGNSNVSANACSAPIGFVSNNMDCNDGNSSIHPGAIEICNSIDDDCDNFSDNGLIENIYYADADYDSYGNVNEITTTCQTIPPLGFVVNSSDCNDFNSLVHPGASDICNGVDDNCDNIIDENAITATISSVGNYTICDGTSIELSANSGPGIIYQWIKNASNISGATSQSFVAKKTGTFKVSETNAYNCSSTSDVLVLTVLSTPTASITPLGNLDICVTGSVKLQANTGAGYTYKWKNGSTIIEGETASTYTATNTGNYKVIVTNSNNCSYTSNSTIVTKSCKTSEEDISLSNFELFPNPVNDLTTIRFTIPLASHVCLKLFDLSGREVITLLNNTLQPGENSFQFNFNNFSKGIYLLELITDFQFQNQ